MAKIKQPKLSVMQQYVALKRDYGFGEIKKIGFSHIVWKGKLKSSPIGDEYLIEVSYKKGEAPKIFILDPPKLKLPDGVKVLEHVYDTKKQRLCLYYPKAKEWKETMTISSTIMPWTIEWLYHYEVWLINGGSWQGGGIHLRSNKKD